jgi:hypothetical protein
VVLIVHRCTVGIGLVRHEGLALIIKDVLFYVEETKVQPKE